jgi:hypothetical protein
MPLKSILNEYKAYAGLSVHWVAFGPNGLKTRPESGGSIRHYTRRNPDPTSTSRPGEQLCGERWTPAQPKLYRCAAYAASEQNGGFIQ